MKESILKEIQVMQELANHPNIVQQIDQGRATYQKDNGKTKEVDYIVLELAQGGELFDFVAMSGRFEEPLARYYL